MPMLLNVIYDVAAWNALAIAYIAPRVSMSLPQYLRAAPGTED